MGAATTRRPLTVARWTRLWSPTAWLMIGAGILVAVAGPCVSGAVSAILIGGSLSVAGRLGTSDAWLTAAGLPVVGFGVGVELSTVVAPLSGYTTTAAFMGTGPGLVAAQLLAAPVWGAIAGFLLIDDGLAAETGLLAGWHPLQAAPWLFGLAQAVAGAVLLALVWRGGAEPPRGAAPRRRAQSRTERPQSVQAAVVFAGAIGVAVIDRLTGNLYEVVLALGVAYLVADAVAHRARWSESGALLTALGAAITTTDFVPVAVSAIDVLVFTAISLAAVVVSAFSLGTTGGVGRSLIVVGLVLGALAAMPHAAAVDMVRSNLDLFLPPGRPFPRSLSGSAGRSEEHR